MKPPVLLCLNHGQNKSQNESECALVESEGESSGGDSSSDAEDGEKGKDLLHKLFEDGGELYKATGHGVGGDCGRVLFYEINGDGEGGYSTVIEVRGWVQEYEARNTERIN